MAPYLLTALIERPKRLVYLTSGLHRGGDPSLEDLTWEKRRWNGQHVLSNSVSPGWVATKMGGAGANDDLDRGHRTQAWLAVSEDAAANVSGKNFYHLKQQAPIVAAHDPDAQQRLLEICEQLSGTKIPKV